MIKKHRDLIAGNLLFLLAIAVFSASFSIPRGAALGIGSDFMPKVTSAIMMIFGFLIAIQGGKKLRETKTDGETETTKSGEGLKVVATIILLFCYMLLYVKVGFLIMTVLYLFAQMMVFAPRAERNYLKFALISVISSAAIYVVFVYGFALMLPSGFIG